MAAQILLVGADNFPFPIPLKKNGDGKWFFDTAAGKEEVLNRRIGRNELAIIEVCGAVADAQAEYFSRFTMAKRRNNTRRSSSATRASRMACTGSRRMASPRARSGRWQRSRPPKDIA